MTDKPMTVTEETIRNIWVGCTQDEGVSRLLKLIDSVRNIAENEALERAAVIVDRHNSGIELCAEGVAERIRSLKHKEG